MISTNQLLAEIRVLEFKLDNIRTFINRRKEIVDSIVRNELENILKLISKYEVVPANWNLDIPFVSNLKDTENK